MLRKVWRCWVIARRLYIRNSAPVSISTNHPILTISSDDWDSVFMKNNSGGESAKEIKALGEILSQNTDIRGRPAVLNAYIVTALPDFDSIAKSKFKEYVFYPTYRPRPDVVKAWLAGCKSGVFSLEFHARDHFNYEAWLNYLRSDCEYFLQGFREEVIRYREGGKEMMRRMPELQYFSREYIDGTEFPSTSIPLSKQNQIMMDGISAFRDMFGFSPKGFIAPGCCFDEVTEVAASNNGILYVETYLEHTTAIDNDGAPIFRRLRWGDKLVGGVTALIRNTHYEPDWRKSGWGESDKESVKANQKIALIEIMRAFRRKEPAILSTHAQNYKGLSANLREFSRIKLKTPQNSQEDPTSAKSALPRVVT